jgi:hypothetical protein
MVDVFISYAHKDVHAISLLAEHIETFGLRAWWDRNLVAGRRFDREIEQFITAAKSVVVVWSAASVDSDWVYAEANEAREQRKLVPAQIEACSIPLVFRRLQTVQLAGWKGDKSHREFQRLLSAVRSIVGSGNEYGGGAGGGGPWDPGAREPAKPWNANLNSFEWTGARFTLSRAGTAHAVEYRNHFSHESVYVDGVEVCSGGTESAAHPAFQFFVEAAGESHTCVVEPVYSLFSRWVTVRLSKLRVTMDGRLLTEFTRR